MPTKTKLVVIVHNFEIRKPTNTGSLASHCLEGSELHIWGRLGAPAFQSNLIDDQERIPLLLFPSDHARVLDQELVASLKKPPTLIAPDGNWKQASHMQRRVPALKNAIPIKIPVGDPTEYHLRREPRERPEGLATMEAISRAMRILEGETCYQHMMKIFRIKVLRSLWIRGKITSLQLRQSEAALACATEKLAPAKSSEYSVADPC